jgi:oxygen-dependent protoporphyrinogen oxidase
MPRVVIVGAGISGLALAYRLQQLAPPTEIVLLEQAERPGGTLWTTRRDGFQVETGANGFLDSKPTTLELCTELGLKDRLLTASEAASKNRYLYLDGRLRILPGSLGGLLRTDLLSWRGKLNFLWERFRKAGAKGDESIAAFATRRAGKEIAAVFADAMVTGIYAGDPELLSLPACFPRIAALEREYGSILKGFGKTARKRRLDAAQRSDAYRRPGTMWSLREGLRVLIEALRDRLKSPPICGAAVRKVEKQPVSSGQRWRVHGEGQERWSCDAVILACPAYVQAKLLGDLDGDLAQRIAGIPYNRLAVVALGYRRQDVPMSVDGFGYIAPQRTRRDLLGVQWCSSIFPGRAPEGAVLMRAMCGGWHRGEMLDWDDERLGQSARAELRQTMGISAAPFFQEIIRWDRAIPQYHVGHLDRLMWLEERTRLHPGLFLAGNAYHGVSLNDCTEQGLLLARKLHSYLQQNGAA